MKYTKHILLTFVLSFLFCVTTGFAASETQSETNKCLTILHTNDIHARLVPTFNKKEQEVNGGAIERSGLINEIKQKVGKENVLLLDAGDLSQGTPFYSVFKGKANFSAAKLMDYDAITTGNHEYGNGMAALHELLDATKMRLLCCNVLHKGTNKPVFQPYHVFVRAGLKIAVIGCIGREAWEDVDMKIRAPMTHIHEIEAIKTYAQKLRPYVDLIVVLSHSGVENERELAAQIGEIDVIIGAHTHTALHKSELIANLPGVTGCLNGLNATILAQAGDKGTYVGRIFLEINKKNKIKSYQGELIKVLPEHKKSASPDVIKLVNYYESLLKGEMDAVVGYSDKPVKGGNRLNYMPMGHYAAEGMRYATDADMCVINSGGVKADIGRGNITKGDLYSAIPYDNTVINFTMKGKEIQRTLDYLAENDGKHCGLQFAGLSCVFNILLKKAESVMVRGKPLVLDKDYVVATTSFMANGNDCGDVFFANVSKIEDKEILMRDAAVKYTQDIKVLPDFTIPNYTFIR